MYALVLVYIYTTFATGCNVISSRILTLMYISSQLDGLPFGCFYLYSKKKINKF